MGGRAPSAPDPEEIFRNPAAPQAVGGILRQTHFCWPTRLLKSDRKTLTLQLSYRAASLRGGFRRAAPRGGFGPCWTIKSGW